MPRQKTTRRIRSVPSVGIFRPHGMPLARLEEVNMALEEYEAIRLADLEGYDQIGAAKKMNVSRATFGRVINQARQKMADALVHGKALRIEGVLTVQTRMLKTY